MTNITKPKHLLFVCSFNEARSPTAESLFQASNLYEVKSAGIAPLSNRVVDPDLLEWSDIIFVMSERDEGHASYLVDVYGVSKKKIIDLDIPDRFERGEPELILLLKEKVSFYLDLDF